MLLDEVERKAYGLALVSLVLCTVLVLPGADDKMELQDLLVPSPCLFAAVA
jgi:hypothetical protein